MKEILKFVNKWISWSKEFDKLTWSWWFGINVSLCYIFRCIDKWFEKNRSCPEHPSDWGEKDETTVINTLQRRGLYLHVFSSDHIKQMCTDKYGLSLQTSFILESVCNYDDIRCQVMERGGLQFLIAATKEIPHFPFSKR